MGAVAGHLVVVLAPILVAGEALRWAATSPPAGICAAGTAAVRLPLEVGAWAAGALTARLLSAPMVLAGGAVRRGASPLGVRLAWVPVQLGTVAPWPVAAPLAAGVVGAGPAGVLPAPTGWRPTSIDGHHWVLEDSWLLALTQLRVVPAESAAG